MPATTTRQISGVLLRPDAVPFANVSLTIFRDPRAAVGQGGAIVVDQVLTTQTGPGGEVSMALLPGKYLGQVRLSDADRYFQFAVPDTSGPFLIGDLLTITEVSGGVFMTLQDLAILARAWAENPEDDPVLIDPDQFSAKHHATKSAASAGASASSAGLANSEANRAEVARDDAQGVLPDRLRRDVAALLADTTLTYAAGQPGTVTAVDIVRTRADGFSYQVAASGATDHHVATVGGVKLYVMPASDGAYHTRAFGSVGGTDESAIFDKAVLAAAGRTLVISKGGAELIGDRIIPAANTTVIFEPGVIYNVKTGGTRAIQIQQANIHVWGYGAQIKMDGSQNSHGVYFNSGGTNIARDCSVRGLHVTGSGNSGDDCFYIGGDPANNILSQNIAIIDCKGEGIGAGTRNIVSVVACDSYLIEGCEFWNAFGSVGAGIDLEANLYMADGTSAVKRGIIRRNRIHSNKSGIVLVFFDDVLIEENEVYGNDGDGIGSAAGGTQFDDSVFRTGDRLGVISIDPATGWITVEDINKLTDDLGIEVGTVIRSLTRAGSSWPTEITTNYWIINEISADQFSFRIGPAYLYGTLTTFSSAGSGTLSKDPLVSGLHCYVYREGNNSNVTISRNKLYDNALVAPAAVTQLKLAQGVNWRIMANWIIADEAGVGISYGKGVQVFRNRIEAKARQVVSYRAMTIGVCSEVETRKNRMVGFSGDGFRISGSNAICADDEVINCGYVFNTAMQVDAGSQMFLSPIIRNDDAFPCINGLFLTSTTSRCIVQNARCKGAGNSNANSIINSGTKNRVIDSIMWDGTFYGELLTAWNPTSIANGASITQPFAFTGVRPGDFVVASLENNTVGLAASASAYNNGVRVTLTNNTGAAVDLAETNLRIKLMTAN
jgi:hypothetical protein